MSPRTTEQFEEIRENRKKQIMDVALELFSEQGYQSTSISQIASKIKISKGLIYNYFTSKEELLREIIFSIVDYLIEIFDPNKDGVLTEEELVYFINMSFDTIKKDIKYWKLYFTLLMQPLVFRMFDNKLMELIMPLLNILESYYAEKGVENPQAQARLFAATLDGIGFGYVLDPDNFPLDDVKELVIKKYV